MMKQTNFDFSPLALTLDPFENFERWLKDAEVAHAPEPTAMTLATASLSGQPRARIVLFKGLSPGEDARRRFAFFTNYTSPKSDELAANERAALVFFWAPLGRQIRIEGRVQKLSAAESDEYFSTRPRGSQIGAWASPQSQKIASRADLLERVAAAEKRFAAAENIARPEGWGGWGLLPEMIEFWQAGEFRLHDRFVFEWTEAAWRVARLAP